MKKRLFVIRHAKSSWADRTLSDHDRPLTHRGKEAAYRMGEDLANRSVLPTLVLCSPALRTRMTWQIMSMKIDLARHPSLMYVQDFYHADADELLAGVRRYGDEHQAVGLVGHNFSVRDLVMMLVPDGDRRKVDKQLGKFPTAAIAELKLDIDSWSHLEAGKGRLVRYMTPKKLGRDRAGSC